MPAALESRSAAAAMGADPFVSQVVEAGKAFILIDLAKQDDVAKYLGGDFQFTGLLTTPGTTRERAEATQRLVNALYRACRFLGANSPEQVVARLPREVTGEDVAVYTLGLRHQYPALSKDCAPTSEGMDNFIKSQVVANVITESESPKPEDLIDLSFVRKAAQR
jgi:NitT/TauT family transport system substrate-binding protein